MCTHVPKILVIAGREHALCEACGAVLSLRTLIGALTDEQRGRHAAERKLARATKTVETIALRNTWDGEMARQCLDAIGHEAPVLRRTGT
jgi:hypothetical protein